ncbi:MAG: hypothetical protein EA387_09200 [Nitriliruptor sp.]|nr:MAG: hypothetical protein EA387_09200 [Nitriliruptor sp.]
MLDNMGLLMARTALIGAVVALLVALVAVGGAPLGITTIWPVLLAIGVGLAARPVTIGRIAAYAVGTAAAWAAIALGAGALPQTASADAIAVLAALAILIVLAAVTADRFPLWAGLAGYAAFAGYYEPIYAANPTLFLSESPVALLTVLLAGAVGFAIASLADLLTAGVSDPQSTVDDHALMIEGEAL